MRRKRRGFWRRIFEEEFIGRLTHSRHEQSAS
jgi:siroheme synthase (precorrin-2 oxidase/ferrochelatase)